MKSVLRDFKGLKEALLLTDIHTNYINSDQPLLFLWIELHYLLLKMHYNFNRALRQKINSGSEDVSIDHSTAYYWTHISALDLEVCSSNILSFYLCIICIGEDDLRLWQTHNNNLCKSVELDSHLHSSIMFTTSRLFTAPNRYHWHTSWWKHVVQSNYYSMKSPLFHLITNCVIIINEQL